MDIGLSSDPEGALESDFLNKIEMLRLGSRKRTSFVSFAFKEF
ncbi:MAG: hypothetical protein ACOYN5_09280 [Bacteroidales bacterium]